MQHGFLEFLWLVQFLRSSTTTYLPNYEIEEKNLSIMLRELKHFSYHLKLWDSYQVLVK